MNTIPYPYLGQIPAAQQPGVPVMAFAPSPGYAYGPPPINAPIPPPAPVRLPSPESYKEYLRRCGVEFATEPFDYGVDLASAASIAAGATATGNINITQEADFVAEKLTYFCLANGLNMASATTTNMYSLFTVQFVLQGSGHVLSNTALPIATIVGTAQRPGLWKPFVLRRNSTFTINVANMAATINSIASNAATIAQLFIVLRGYKIFDPAAQNLNVPPM